MSKATMSSPFSVKVESGSATKDISSSFKSLKRSLKDTLERLETIGINDSELGDEVSMLKSQIMLKDKIIEDQALELERLKLILSKTDSKGYIIYRDKQFSFDQEKMRDEG